MEKLNTYEMNMLLQILTEHKEIRV